MEFLSAKQAASKHDYVDVEIPVVTVDDEKEEAVPSGEEEKQIEVD